MGNAARLLRRNAILIGNKMNTQAPHRMFLSTCLACLVLCNTPGIIDKIRAKEAPVHSLRQADDGSIILNAADAKIRGPNAKLEGGDVKGVMWWTNMDTSLQWTAHVQKPGRYRVELTYAIVGNNNGSPLAVMVGDQVVKAIPKAGNGFNDYITASAGEVTISKPGDLEAVVKPLEKSHEFVITIRSLALIPVGTPGNAIDISGSPIKPSDDGSIKLGAAEADIDGMNAQLEGTNEKNIGFWRDVDTLLLWSVNVQKPGNYRVELNYSLMPGYEGSKVAISIGDQTVKAKPKPTGKWTDYKTGDAGEVTISEPGDYPVVVKALSKPWGFVMNLRSITLIPAGSPTRAIDISDKALTQAADGSLKLTALNAELDGQTARLEGVEKKYIAWWNSPTRFIKWPIRVDKPGTFTVRFTYALAISSYTSQVQFGSDGGSVATLPPTINDSSEVTMSVNGQTLTATFKAGNGLSDFKTEKVGEMSFDKPGEYEVVLKSNKELGALVMNLEAVSLIPVGK